MNKSNSVKISVFSFLFGCCIALSPILTVYERGYFLLCLYLICSYQYPRMTCNCWVGDRVGSSSGKVLKWDENLRLNPLQESHLVKGKGQDTMIYETAIKI